MLIHIYFFYKHINTNTYRKWENKNKSLVLYMQKMLKINIVIYIKMNSFILTNRSIKQTHFISFGWISVYLFLYPCHFRFLFLLVFFQFFWGFFLISSISRQKNIAKIDLIKYIFFGSFTKFFFLIHSLLLYHFSWQQCL